MSGSLYDYVSPTGVIVPDTASILTEVQSEWQGVFGTGLNTDSSTPQGLMIAAEVAARVGVVGNNAAVANQINPNQAAGLFLDAICALSGLERQANTFTTVPNVLLSGVQGSPIPAGLTVATGAGDLFELLADVTLDPSSGTATGTFVAVQPGPVAAPAGTWTIESGALGLETVVNPATALPGTAQQSDQALRALRRVTLALQGVSLIEACISSVNALPGVLSVRFLENVQASTQTIQTISMVARSIWVCVDGGTNADIAAALLENKSGGCDWNGGVTVAVTEPASGQSYTVKFDRPTLVPLLVRVTVSQGSFIGNPSVSVTQAVLDFANNKIPDLQGFILGQSASPFEVAAGVNAECQGLYVKKVELSLASSVDYQPAEIAMAINQKATVVSGNVTVVVV